VTLRTWPAIEPPHELRALLYRLAHPPTRLSPEAQAAIDKAFTPDEQLVDVEQLPARKGWARIAA